MEHLRGRQEELRREAEDARERTQRHARSLRLMTAVTAQREYEDAIKGRWSGGPTVLAFLFALPDSDVIRSLDTGGDYFDHRTNANWDLFFPGYFRARDSTRDQLDRARPIGGDYASDWYFSPRGFAELRAHVEAAGEGRWQFSGGADLVLVNGMLPETGEPTIDWASILSGQLTDGDVGVKTLTLGAVVERISRDLEQAVEDPAYGVGPVVVGQPAQPDRAAARELITNALGGIIANLANGQFRAH
jgi:hypothetical protein